MLQTIMEGTNAEVIEGILDICFTDSSTYLDCTYGNGSFWSKSNRAIVGLDILGDRSLHIRGDFTRLPFRDNTFDVVVFDPPFQTDMGKKKASVMGKRFATYPNLSALRFAVLSGLSEAYRVSKLGIIYKCQDYIHASKPVWMSTWAQDYFKQEYGLEPFDVVYLKQSKKMIYPKWKNQLSVWRNHSTFWIYRKDGIVHKNRRAKSIP